MFKRGGGSCLTRENFTHGRHGKRNVRDDGERVVKLLVEAHEPQSVERLYIREAPTIEAARRTAEAPRSQGRTGRDAKRTHLSLGALVSGSSSSCGAACST